MNPLDTSLPSPSFCIDLDRLERNAARFLSLGLPIRPHLKTAKCVEVAKLLVNGDLSNGLVCSTVAEVEYFASHGFTDLTYGVPIEPSKLPRLLALRPALPLLRLMVDSAEGLASLLGALATATGPALQPLQVWVSVSAGYNREGVAHDSPAALALIAAVHAASPALALCGLYSHSGDSYCGGKAGALAAASQELARMAALAALAAAQGTPPPLLSLGATPSTFSGQQWAAAFPLQPSPTLELHAGNYCFFDRQQVASGSCSLEEIAVYVLARVVGAYPERNTILIDAGACALHKDAGGLDTWGCLRDDPSMVLRAMTQEVSVVSTLDGSPIDYSRYRIGAEVRVLCNHSCMTAAMFPHYNITRAAGAGRAVTAVWKPCKYW